MQLNSFHNFRAIAITFIVAGHCYGLTGMEFETLLEITLKNLTAGGSSLFVFISGFLFHHVFCRNFKYKKFMTNKFKKVFIPYIVLGVVPVAYYVITEKIWYDGYFLPSNDEFIGEYMIPTIKYYYTGRFLVAYWFIPFIMCTFLLSPLHVKFIELNCNVQIVIIVILSAVSIVVHRPVDNMSVLQSVIYFSPIYLIGIMSSIYKNIIYAKFKNIEYSLLIFAIGLAFIQAALGQAGNYHKDPFEIGGFDLMFPQKIILCLFFMTWLNKYEEFENSKIRAVTSTSFAIFFIHPLLIGLLDKSGIEFIKLDSWLVFAVVVVAIIVACVSIAIITKRFLRTYSQYLIGY